MNINLCSQKHHPHRRVSKQTAHKTSLGEGLWSLICTAIYSNNVPWYFEVINSDSRVSFEFVVRLYSSNFRCDLINKMVFIEYIPYAVLRRTWCEPTLLFKKKFFFIDPMWLPDHMTDNVIFIKSYFLWVVDQLFTFCIDRLSGFSDEDFERFFPSI